MYGDRDGVPLWAQIVAAVKLIGRIADGNRFRIWVLPDVSTEGAISARVPSAPLQKGFSNRLEGIILASSAGTTGWNEAAAWNVSFS